MALVNAQIIELWDVHVQGFCQKLQEGGGTLVLLSNIAVLQRSAGTTSAPSGEGLEKNLVFQTLKMHFLSKNTFFKKIAQQTEGGTYPLLQAKGGLAGSRSSCHQNGISSLKALSIYMHDMECHGRMRCRTLNQRVVGSNPSRCGICAVL
jgi:hypothetical protein